ncbi:hypothetical protein [Streptomyces marispadix]|uniref:DUF3592 domain-containing protein n=1 Tax=Streptomyces marispadix TaxID=2922868 RepID=A0ABS9T4J4_9ACTN|nr:hypothetical protein [Streptomyces marispadix]MCH6163473.1 hypothetical protein [Streptomyces marispadix]
MQRALRRHGPWLCVLALAGLLVQGMVKYAAPAPRWDMVAWTALLAVAALVVWRVRKASSPQREVRASRWHYGRGAMVLAGVFAAGVVGLFLGVGVSEFTPKVQRILEADPVIRSSQVTEVTKVSGDDSGRGPDQLSYTIHHRVRFDSGTETVESTVDSFRAISPGSTVWVLYDPGKPDIGGHTEESKDELEALQGGTVDTFWMGITAGNLGLAGLFAAMALFGTNKLVRDGSRRGSLRCAPATSGRTGVARHRPPERTNNRTERSELREKSGPFVELVLQGGAVVRLFVDKIIEAGALAQQLGEATGTLYWDGVPPVRGADATWALFVLDSGEEIPGVVQRSDSFDWQTAGAQVDRTDTRALERRPVVHPVTWQPGVQVVAVPFIAAAVGALLAYAYLGSAIALVVAWAMLPLALGAVYIARGMHLDEAVPEAPPVDMGKAR